MSLDSALGRPLDRLLWADDERLAVPAGLGAGLYNINNNSNHNMNIYIYIYIHNNNN